MRIFIDKFWGIMSHEHLASDIIGLPETSYTNQWYGVKRLIGQTSSTLTRIGNTDLHKVNGGLPVQSLMRRCVLKADGTVNYYLGATDSTKNSAFQFQLGAIERTAKSFYCIKSSQVSIPAWCD